MVVNTKNTVFEIIYSGTCHQVDHLISDPIAIGQNLNTLDSFLSSQLTRQETFCAAGRLYSAQQILFLNN